MNSIVHRSKENTARSLRNICVPAVQENRNMMIPMQEDERLFMNDDEKSVQELTGDGTKYQRKRLRKRSKSNDQKIKQKVRYVIVSQSIRSGVSRFSKPYSRTGIY